MILYGNELLHPIIVLKEKKQTIYCVILLSKNEVS